MRKLFFVILAWVLLTGTAYGQSSQQVFSRIRDATNINSMAAVGQFSLTMPTTTYALAVEAGVYFYNGANLYRLAGSVLSGETVADTTYAPHGITMLYGHDLSPTATWRYIHTVDQQADGLALTTNGLATSSMLYGYSASAATMNMLRLGTSNELYVTDIASRPGEDAVNDWVDIQKRETYAPAVVTKTGTAIDTNLTTVMDAKVVVQDVNWCVYVKNVGGGGGNAFSDVQVQSSPDNSSWTGDLGWTGCDSAASGVTCTYCVNGSAYNYIRVQAKVGAGSTTVTTWYFANKN